MTSVVRPRAAAVLALAAIAYGVAAWAVAPGFYDGIAPPAPYRWVSPPPQFRSTNQQPLSGHMAVKVNGGRVDPASVFTQDGQAAISFTQGAFVAPANGSGVTIQIAPQPTFPDPGGTQLATNVYCFTSSSPLGPGKDALITLQYSAGVPAPSDVYGYQGDGPWRKIGNTGSAAPFYIAARVTALGCFAGGYPRNAAQTAQGARLGGQSLPIIVALAILVVVLAGIPLAVLRRRGGADDDG
ncbi:MAG TPA: hypothetical protein VOB72_17280 [Candidatus Dormibacteraeota bacterium]|nr:hypothetical protein [Candidatus Dormibacteraeota bacterium]